MTIDHPQQRTLIDVFVLSGIMTRQHAAPSKNKAVFFETAERGRQCRAVVDLKLFLHLRYRRVLDAMLIGKGANVQVNGEITRFYAENKLSIPAAILRERYRIGPIPKKRRPRHAVVAAVYIFRLWAFNRFSGETTLCSKKIILTQLNSAPFATQSLSHFTSDTASREWIKYKVSGIGQHSPSGQPEGLPGAARSQCIREQVASQSGRPLQCLT